MTQLLVYGAGGHAKMVVDAARRQAVYQVVGCISDRAEDAGRDVLGVKVVGTGDDLARLRRAGASHAIVAVGDRRARPALAARLRQARFALANVVDPSAFVSEHATLGTGIVVAPRGAINAGARIGDNVIVNTGAIVDHDCDIADDVHLCPGVTLGGWVKVGAGAWIGIGGTLLDRAEIGAGATVGGGAVVLARVEPHTTVVGVPARPIARTV